MSIVTLNIDRTRRNIVSTVNGQMPDLDGDVSLDFGGVKSVGISGGDPVFPDGNGNVELTAVTSVNGETPSESGAVVISTGVQSITVTGTGGTSVTTSDNPINPEIEISSPVPVTSVTLNGSGDTTVTPGGTPTDPIFNIYSASGGQVNTVSLTGSNGITVTPSTGNTDTDVKLTITAPNTVKSLSLTGAGSTTVTSTGTATDPAFTISSTGGGGTGNVTKTTGDISETLDNTSGTCQSWVNGLPDMLLHAINATFRPVVNETENLYLDFGGRYVGGYQKVDFTYGSSTNVFNEVRIRNLHGNSVMLHVYAKKLIVEYCQCGFFLGSDSALTSNDGCAIELRHCKSFASSCDLKNAATITNTGTWKSLVSLYDNSRFFSYVSMFKIAPADNENMFLSGGGSIFILSEDPYPGLHTSNLRGDSLIILGNVIFNPHNIANPS